MVLACLRGLEMEKQWLRHDRLAKKDNHMTKAWRFWT
jgi:hypothetical protein